MNKYNTIPKVHNHALEVIGKPMEDIFEKPLVGKSGPGDAFEHWFDKAKDSASEPDMSEAGVELKATPIKKLKKTDKNGNSIYSAKERLVLNIINYDKLAKEDFETSHFLHKNGTIELAFYESVKGVPKDKWQFKEVALFKMAENATDYKVIRNDWNRIQQYVLDGKADELNEGITDYLAPCTKGANAKSMRTQPFSEKMAKQRAFSLKTGYMNNLLRTKVLGDEPSKSIFKGKFDLKDRSIEDVILERLSKWTNRTTKSLRKEFDIKTKRKSFRYLLASRMIGLDTAIDLSEDGNYISEFEKGNIVPKTVTFDEWGVNHDSMSFPAFNFKDLAKQTWNDEDGMASADWHVFLQETKLLLLVFQQIKGEERFIGAKFFKIPTKDLEGQIKAVWQDTVDKLNNGVELKARETTDKRVKSGFKIYNNFIGIKADRICHVRPHDNTASYSPETKGGNQLPVAANWLNKPDDECFTDNWMTTQSFWLNAKYIRQQVEDLLQ